MIAPPLAHAAHYIFYVPILLVIGYVALESWRQRRAAERGEAPDAGPADRPDGDATEPAAPRKDPRAW